MYTLHSHLHAHSHSHLHAHVHVHITLTRTNYTFLTRYVRNHGLTDQVVYDTYIEEIPCGQISCQATTTESRDDDVGLFAMPRHMFQHAPSNSTSTTVSTVAAVSSKQVSIAIVAGSLSHTNIVTTTTSKSAPQVAVV